MPLASKNCIGSDVAKTNRKTSTALALVTYGTLMAAAASCAFSPPLSEAPTEQDTPPFFLLEELSPPTERPVTINLARAVTEVFSSSTTFDWNESDRLRYQWIAYHDGTPRMLPLSELRSLTPSAVQRFDGATSYEPVELELAVCELPLVPVAGARSVVIELRVFDELPAAQAEARGFDTFEVTAAWFVRLEADCPVGG